MGVSAGGRIRGPAVRTSAAGPQRLSFSSRTARLARRSAMDGTSTPLVAVVALAGGLVAFAVAWLVQGRLAASGLKRARSRAEELLGAAVKEAEAMSRSASLAAKEEALRQKTRLDEDL